MARISTSLKRAGKFSRLLKNRIHASTLRGASGQAPSTAFSPEPVEGQHERTIFNHFSLSSVHPACPERCRREPVEAFFSNLLDEDCAPIMGNPTVCELQKRPPFLRCLSGLCEGLDPVCQPVGSMRNFARSMERLVLFDIDGTLTRTQNGHLPFNDALLKTFGIAGDIRSVIPDGNTDPLIVEEIFAAARLKIEITAEQWEGFARRLGESYLEAFASGSATVIALPGVSELLGALSEEAGTDQSVVTGNFETVARVKLQTAGLHVLLPRRVRERLPSPRGPPRDRQGAMGEGEEAIDRLRSMYHRRRYR